MDWKKTFNRGNWIVHSIFAVTILASLASIFYASRLYHLQENLESRDRKITSLIEKIRAEDIFQKMKKNLLKSQPEVANDKLRELSGMIAELEDLLETRASEPLGSSVREFTKLIHQTSGNSNPKEALGVFYQKLQSLKKLGEDRNYKNVILYTSKILEKLVLVQKSKKIDLKFIESTQTDLGRLLNIIKSSSLDDQEKQNLLSRIEGMREDIELTKGMAIQLKDVELSGKNATLNLEQWILELENKMRNVQSIFRDKQATLIVMMGSSFAILLIGWISVAYLFRWQKIKISEQVETEVDVVIQKGIMEDQRFMTEHYSEKMREKVINLLDELKVKLNLGTMLYDGLPFAGCLIDRDLNLTWSNRVFLDSFKINQSENDYKNLNWNNLRKIFYIDGDPIKEAFENKTSGIYALKVRFEDSHQMEPFELYVRPIEFNREDRVMIFFYPLNSVKDAISDQVSIAKDTIERFVELWSSETLSNEQLQLLEKDFKSSDLDALYGQLVTFYQKQESDKLESHLMIETLEKENSNYNLILDEVRQIEDERKSIIKSEVQILDSIKDLFISTFDKTDSLLHFNRSLMQINDDFKSEAQKISSQAGEIFKRSKESIDLLTQLDQIRGDYKKLKLDLIDVKCKLVAFHSSLISNLPPLDDHQQKLVLRYKDELAKLEVTSTSLDKKLSQLDIFLGKFSYMQNLVGNDQISFNFNNAQKDHEIKENLFELQKKLTEDEESIISNFKELHHLMRLDLAKGQAVSHNVSIEGTPLN